MVWIALHLPLLSLETFAATLDRDADDPPVAFTDAHVVVAANAAAQALGVKAGLRRATALALAPHIVLGQADASRDAEAVRAIAHAALAFTPTVALDAPDDPAAAPHTVLLEVQASLRYFGGLRALLRRLQSALQPLARTVHCATAPTAQGAALLARLPEAPGGRHAADRPALERLLDEAPVWLLGPGREHWEALQGMGLRTVSDLRGLPRSGLARRFGASLLDQLDRARGLRPDPRVCVTLPDVFDGRLELFARADTTEQVLHGASLLLARLVAWAAAQHAQVRRFTLHMQHERRHRRDAAAPPATALEIALAEPSRDIDHLRVLLRERLARLQLAAPTLDLRLECRDIARGAPPHGELFPTAKSEREGLTRLIERLQARLGAAQVQRLHAVQDHRPECATASSAAQAAPVEAALRRGGGRRGPAPPGPGREAAASRLAPWAAVPSSAPRPPSPSSLLSPPNPSNPSIAPRPPSPPSPPSPPRPLWLLPEPEPLQERQRGPLLDGRPLQLLCGPERIESGWWDAALAERDYFIAQAPDGALVWIYRARLPIAAPDATGWFLQGRFG